MLAFALDVAERRVHTLRNAGGVRAGVEIAEQDVEHYVRYIHSVV